MLAAHLLNTGSELFGRKWRIAILLILQHGPKRFSEIKKELPECSVKVLSEALSDMERANVLVRKQYEAIPVKVTYEINSEMQEITDILRLYYKALLVYFKANHKIKNFPPDVMNLLNGE